MTPDMSIGEARNYVRQNLEDGVDCPACDQYCKLYHRSLYSTLALDMIALYRLTRANPERQYFRVLEIYEASRIRLRPPVVISIASHWGLVESAGSSRRDDGAWKITDKGIAFVKGEISLPRTANLYNDHALEFSEEQVRIEDCIKNKFDFNELMGGDSNVV